MINESDQEQGLPKANIDQESWVLKRLEEYQRLLEQIYFVKRGCCGACQPMIEGAIEGARNGVAIEIIRTLGMQPSFVNIKKPSYEMKEG